MPIKSLSLTGLAERLIPKKDTYILFHVRPDGDAVGSALSLKLILEAMGSRVACLCADNIPERLAFMANGLNVSAEDVEFLPERIISVDSASPGQLGSLFDRYGQSIDLMIDHHESGERYADNYVRSRASATGEIIYGISRKLYRMGYDTVSREIDTFIYCAICSDTGCFRYGNVTPDTMRITTHLLESGVPAAEINHLLFGIKSLKQMQVEHAGFERMNFYNDGRVAIITFPYGLKRDLGVEDCHLETLVDVARCVSGVKIAASIRQSGEEPVFRVSMRSSCEVNVSEICAEFGGGGHLKAAACTLPAGSAAEAELIIAEAIAGHLQ